MSAHTSFKVGGPARYFVKAERMDDLKSALSLAREKGLPYFVLGNGTNLLVSDRGYEGVVICLAREFSEIVDMGGGKFKVGAATPLDMSYALLTGVVPENEREAVVARLL
jgi:UDP-N-acetylmuramate dehydrogenase